MSRWKQMSTIVCFTVFLTNQLANAFECGVRKVPIPENASEDYPGKWPWYGVIYSRKSNQFFDYACGGTLITSKHVLTTTNCVMYDNSTVLESSNILVAFGVYQLNVLNFGAAQYRNVRFIHQSNDFEPTLCSVVVLLELLKSAQFGDFVQPACIYKDNLEDDVMIGWSKMNGRKSVVTNITSNICNEDKASIAFSVRKDVWSIEAIVYCTFPSIHCDPLPSRRSTNVVIFRYINWISNITQLAYLNVIRYGRDFDPSRKYPNILPRWNCGNVVRNPAIVSVYNFPWMAYIVHFMQIYGFSMKTISEGTLISHRYVLSLAYSKNFGLPNFVQLGKHAHVQDGSCSAADDDDDCVLPVKTLNVEYVMIHQKFDVKRKDKYNIALLRLRSFVAFEGSYSFTVHNQREVFTSRRVMEPTIPTILNAAEQSCFRRLPHDSMLSENDNISPVCLPLTPQLKRTAFSEYLVTSWGGDPQDLLDKGPKFANLHMQRLHSTNSTECHSSENSIFCLEKDDKHTVMLGAPAVRDVDYNGYRYVQFGMAVINFEGIFLNVSEYVDWIKANIEI